MVAVEVRLRIGMALEIVEADAVAARADARMQRAERLGGDVLEDHQAGHDKRVLMLTTVRLNIFDHKNKRGGG